MFRERAKIRAVSERIVIIGAGMAGLGAAVSLREVGFQPVLVDKSRAVGGRMSTRTIGDARFDQGAQHFGIESDSVAKLLEPAIEAGVVRSPPGVTALGRRASIDGRED